MVDSSVDSRAAMLTPILASTEYRSKMLDTETLRLLTVPYDPEEVAFWIYIFNEQLSEPTLQPFLNIIQIRDR
jgi:hypothetical protein